MVSDRHGEGELSVHGRGKRRPLRTKDSTDEETRAKRQHSTEVSAGPSATEIERQFLKEEGWTMRSKEDLFREMIKEHPMDVPGPEWNEQRQEMPYLNNSLQWGYENSAFLDRMHNYHYMYRGAQQRLRDMKELHNAHLNGYDTVMYRNNVSVRSVERMKQFKETMKKRRTLTERYLRNERSAYLPKGQYLVPKKAHMGGEGRKRPGDEPEHVYFTVFCNNHPRWYETDGFPVNFQQEKNLNATKWTTLKKLHYNTLLDGRRDIWREPREMTFRLNWGVFNDTETIAALFKWFHLTADKTHDYSCMMKFSKQYGLWRSRKWLISRMAKDAGMPVLWPIRSKRQRHLYVMRKDFYNWDIKKEARKYMSTMEYPWERSYKDFLQDEREKYLRQLGRWEQKHKHNFTNEPSIPLTSRLNNRDHFYQLMLNETLFEEFRWMVKYLKDTNEDKRMGYRWPFIVYVLRYGLLHKLPPKTHEALETGRMARQIIYNIKYDHPERLRECLEKRPDLVNSYDMYPETQSVMLAVKLNKTECLRILLDYGGDMDTMETHETLNMEFAGQWSCLKYAREREFYVVVAMLEEERKKRVRETFKRLEKEYGRKYELDWGQDVFKGLADDVQGIKLTGGSQKIFRCPECTMPLRKNVTFPCHCKSCGYKVDIPMTQKEPVGDRTRTELTFGDLHKKVYGVSRDRIIQAQHALRADNDEENYYRPHKPIHPDAEERYVWNFYDPIWNGGKTGIRGVPPIENPNHYDYQGKIGFKKPGYVNFHEKQTLHH